MKRTVLLFIALLPVYCFAQELISGTVYDSSKSNFVENVRVVSTGGMFAVTDSFGRYSILVNEKDSILFIYNNKPTQKFPVSTITSPHQFDISLRVSVKGKYSVLKEVVLYARSYRQDSLENRETYADIYNYSKPGISSNLSESGVAGADLNELINIFRFKRNRNMRAFQQRLQKQEEERYINYRFNKAIVRRITGLQHESLDSFLVWYKPSYEFIRNSNEIEFTQYILNCSYQFKKFYALPPSNPE